MLILGISAFYHDSAAALIRDEEIVAAAQLERFNRKKHDYRFPREAVAYCLKEAGISIDQLDYVVFYDKPFIKFERILESYLAMAPHGISSFLKAIPVWVKQKLWISEVIRNELNYKGKLLFPEHHESHAASAFFPSPFQEAAFLTLDGVGEWTTTSWGVGRGNQITMMSEIHFPHSLGLLYSALTYYTGFKVNSGEYKVMGLAPYGRPIYVDKILEHLIDVKDDGSFRMNMKYFDYVAGLKMTSSAFNDLFGGPPRQPESKLTQREMDLARSLQDVTELIMLRCARHVRKETGMKELCLAGGVALNCVGNGKILKEKIFDRIWIQPAAGDAGGALGAAYMAYYQYCSRPRTIQPNRDKQQGSYLGPSFSNPDIESFLKNNNLSYRYLNDDDLYKTTADLMAQEKVIGWFRGRMEFGPRALGNRSIIGDARSPKMQSIMNLKIKYRESFRPFAPSILEEHISDYFQIDCPSPYMLLVADVAQDKQLPVPDDKKELWGIDLLNIPKSVIPAITHIDYSARIQSVSRETNPGYYSLINEFHRLTGCPVIINTSFNVRGEPIVCSPSEAYVCFMRTEMDYLVLNNYLLAKTDQPSFTEKTDWRSRFELD
ncbi:MAG: carbamoyltransferase [Candidatus Delongbacteria bacterium]|nr:carbamoyltransferase [Candidatus Delongbacteria bacterium]